MPGKDSKAHISDASSAGGTGPGERVTRKALVVWIAALAVYIVAITGRTSFGVASVEALDRFAVGTAAIALFTSVQVGVYALVQIPMGVAIDRFGPRAMLAVGAIVMGAGQVMLGLTDTYLVALFARVLIGAGDATAFLSVMRLIPSWFPMRTTPLIAQITSAMGQLGQFISAVPFMALLNAQGWTPAFVSLGAVGIIIALAAGVAVQDTPLADATPAARSPRGTKAERPSLRASLRQVVASPLAWQGFFVHFTGLAPVPVFILMWGVPLMTVGMGLSPAQAGTVLTINTIALIILGPLHGFVSRRCGSARHLATAVQAVAHIAAWAWFFAPDTPRSFGAMVVMSVVIALFCPSANYGFDVVREGMPRNVLGAATGLANMGGFIAGMTAAQLCGQILEATGMDWAGFRHAAVGVALVWLVGIVGILLTGRKARTAAPRGSVKVVEEDEV